jgi:hypothetical protein
MVVNTGRLEPSSTGAPDMVDSASFRFGRDEEGCEFPPTPDELQSVLARLIGVAAVVFSALYVISDLLEVAQGGFSPLRLSLTFVSEAAIPFFVLGLYAVQRPYIGRLGLFGALAFSYSYVFFTGTVLLAFVKRIPNYHALTKYVGASMTVHGLIMLVGGLVFGLAVMRARVVPHWTGACLMAGVVCVAAASGLSNVARALAETVTASAFLGMGFALVGGHSSRQRIASNSKPGLTPTPRHQ